MAEDVLDYCGSDYERARLLPVLKEAMAEIGRAKCSKSDSEHGATFVLLAKLDALIGEEK